VELYLILWYGIGMHIIANIGMVYHTHIYIGHDMVDQYSYWYGIGIVMALVCTSLPMHTFVMQWYAKVLVLVWYGIGIGIGMVWDWYWYWYGMV
jgi:hypothetical protein